MKIASIEKHEPYRWSVTFSRDGDTVKKLVHLWTAQKKCSRNHDREFAFNLQKVAREADRDFAFRKHGKDFRAHCEYQSNFWQAMTPAEFEALFS